MLKMKLAGGPSKQCQNKKSPKHNRQTGYQGQEGRLAGQRRAKPKKAVSLSPLSFFFFFVCKAMPWTELVCIVPALCQYYASIMPALCQHCASIVCIRVSGKGAIKMRRQEGLRLRL